MYKIMKILKNQKRIMEIIKIIEFQVRIMKIMKFIELQMRITEFMKIIELLKGNNENHENLKRSLRNYEND